MCERLHIVIVVQNLPLARDRRVLRESAALLQAGFAVTVVCPSDPRPEPLEPEVAGVTVCEYRPAPILPGALGFAVEYAWCGIATLVWLAVLALRRGISAVQVCNPPDTYWPLAMLCRILGTPFVFDHHDLTPEVYAARLGRPSGPLTGLLLWMERQTFRWATAVVATNESFARVAMSRGGRRREDVLVVRNGPVLDQLPAPTTRHREHLLAYVGIMGRQDGVEMLVHALAVLRDKHGRDVPAAFVGDGERLSALRAMVVDLGVADLVTFTGWAPRRVVFEVLDRATLAVQPDPRNPLNEYSTMAKTVEYLAFGLPVVAVDLVETRATAGECALYVQESTPEDLAAAVAELLDDDDRRVRMAEAGRRRVREALAWDHQAVGYVDLFRRLTGQQRAIEGHAGQSSDRAMSPRPSRA